MRRALAVVLVGLLPALLAWGCQKKSETEQKPATEQAAAASEETPSRGEAVLQIGRKRIAVTYGRPLLKGRDVLAMAKDGMVWRMGKDEATELTTEVELRFPNATIAPGKYSLWMKKLSGNDWQLLVNSETGIWGTEHKDEHDIAAIPMQMTDLVESVEAFTIELTPRDGGGRLTAEWGTKALFVDFSVGQ